MNRVVGTVLAVVIIAGGATACARDRVSVTATFDDAGDLQARGSVQVADVRVGQISSLTLTDDFRAEVRMSLNPGVQVPRNSMAILRTTSLLGEKFVELRPIGDPTRGPFLADGDVLTRTAEAPELEFVADQAITALAAVMASDVATIIETGAQAFAGRGPELRQLIDHIATISATFAESTGAIATIIDNLDRATITLGGGASEIDGLLVNLADTTAVLADNRQRAVDAVAQLTRLAAVQNEVLGPYRDDIDRQIKQVNAIVQTAVGFTAEVGLLIDWLDRFAVAVPKAIPGDFTQVYAWVVPAQLDPRVEQ